VLQRTARALRRERSSKPLRELELKEGICGGRTRTSVDDMVGVLLLNRRTIGLLGFRILSQDVRVRSGWYRLPSTSCLPAARKRSTIVAIDQRLRAVRTLATRFAIVYLARPV
jgi:hypothetical protein